MVLADMIDTWLLSALVFGIPALCALLRGVTAKSPDDRLAAGTVALILVSLAVLALSIAWGMILILDGMILTAIIASGAMLWFAGHQGDDRA